MKKILSTLFIILAFGVCQAAETTLFHETFDKLNGIGGNDGYFDNVEDELGNPIIEIAASDLDTALYMLDDPEQWSVCTKVAVCNQCCRLATKKNTGTLTTAAINFNGADAVLTFNAAAQLEDIATLHVTLLGEEGTLSYDGTTASTIDITLPETSATTVLAESKYTIAIQGVSTSAQIQFEVISSKTDKQRVFLDEVLVVAEEITDIESVVDTCDGPFTAYTLTGMGYTVQTVSELQSGIYVINGKKVMVK